MSVTDEAIERIKAMIVSGELRPGDRLPREADLAARLGLSRSSLREAVRALTLVRVLDVRRGDGTYVTSLDSATLLEALSFVVDLHQDRSVLHVLAARRALEVEAAGLAAEHATPEQVARLDELVAAMGDLTDVDEFIANDLAFHRVVAAASANPVLASLLDSVAGGTSRARVWRAITEDGATARTQQEHARIAEAIGAGRADLARAWTTVHLSGVEDWVERAASP